MSFMVQLPSRWVITQKYEKVLPDVSLGTMVKSEAKIG